MIICVETHPIFFTTSSHRSRLYTYRVHISISAYILFTVKNTLNTLIKFSQRYETNIHALNPSKLSIHLQFQWVVEQTSQQARYFLPEFIP